MQLIRFGAIGQERPGLLLKDGRRKDVSSVVRDYDRNFFNDGGLDQLSQISRSPDALPDVPSEARWGAPVSRPGKVICIGLNYADHARESGMPIPAEPVVFLKAANAVVGPYDDLLIPRGSQKTDWEVELGVIMGKDARYLESPAAAEEFIAGYCVSHDVSERHFQLERGGQWVKGKSCDTFNPLGPILVTRDDVGDVNSLDLWLTVNEERRQTGNTRTMIFNPAFVVHYLSQFMTLEAGDLISTGTPPGVGLGMKPPHFLKAGDVVSLGVQGLGEQRQICRNA